MKKSGTYRRLYDMQFGEEVVAIIESESPPEAAELEGFS
jgi:subfamily B ATP-binding cassette protein MsbA